MRIWNLILIGALAAAGLFGQTGFDTAWIDTNADPCTDFYQYSCGVWMEKNPIPADQAGWGRFNELLERNQKILREILEESARASGERTQIEQQIGDYYAACMDEGEIAKRGTSPLEPEFARIEKMSGVKDLPAILARLHRYGVNALFRFGPTPDLKNSTQNIAEVDQGGLGLPDRDYYFREDEKSVELREKYVAHIQAMFQLLGEPAGKAAEQAKTVMAIETALAKGALDRVSRREPRNVYHKMTNRELKELAPSFDWSAYFQAVQSPTFSELNVTEPEFVKAVEAIVAAESPANLKTYLRWHLVRAAAALLPEPFVEENFDFYRRTLQGAKEQRPRWKRCVDMVDDELGEALGQKYVERTFPPESRDRMLKLVRALEDALEKDIQALPWMTRETKDKALEKLHIVTNKIGYPEKWRDYSKLKIVRGDALGNSMRAGEVETNYQLAKIGQPVDPKEWYMTPPTVNAYFHPLENTINFPAGILQPPFFDATKDDAVNFGGIGAVIGHELTHGFDDQGRQFDSEGNLKDWWTEKDAKEFEERAQCFVDQYAAYTAVENVKLNGKLTLGENVADGGGLRIAFMALMETLGDKQPPKIDGFTPEQRIFLGWAQVWCQNTSDEMARLRAQTDPHSPGKYRVNGVVSNMPEFQKAFSCKAGQPMVREDACRVW